MCVETLKGWRMSAKAGGESFLYKAAYSRIGERFLENEEKLVLGIR